ncbi:unnamed protein product [Arctogadus glacialis]
MRNLGRESPPSLISTPEEDDESHSQPKSNRLTEIGKRSHQRRRTQCTTMDSTALGRCGSPCLHKRLDGWTQRAALSIRALLPQ